MCFKFFLDCWIDWLLLILSISYFRCDGRWWWICSTFYYYFSAFRFWNSFELQPFHGWNNFLCVVVVVVAVIVFRFFLFLPICDRLVSTIENKSTLEQSISSLQFMYVNSRKTTHTLTQINVGIDQAIFSETFFLVFLVQNISSPSCREYVVDGNFTMVFASLRFEWNWRRCGLVNVFAFLQNEWVNERTDGRSIGKRPSSCRYDRS